MLLWLDFVAKLAEIIIGRVSKDWLAEPFDRKKRAAEAFLRFHESLLDLEAVADDGLAYLETFENSRNSRVYQFHLESRVLHGLRPALEEFVKSLSELCRVLEIRDPRLAELLWDIRGRKAAVLGSIAALFGDSVPPEVSPYERPPKPIPSRNWVQFSYTVVESTFCSIDYTMPNEALI